eukprot:8553089-Prorocentrum_lima.AAC.1
MSLLLQSDSRQPRTVTRMLLRTVTRMSLLLQSDSRQPRTVTRMSLLLQLTADSRRQSLGCRYSCSQTADSRG